MNTWTRRDLLRASAGAAVAVPMAALSDSVAASSDADDERALRAVTGQGPVMFCVHDASRGEVSILQGDDEVVVNDRRLVARILRAAESSRSSNVISS
jgi:hypothetical protein